MVLLVCTLCGLEEYRIMILFICYDLVQYVIQVLSNTLNFSSLILMQDVLNINTPSCLSSSFFQINLQHTHTHTHTHTLTHTNMVLYPTMGHVCRDMTSSRNSLSAYGQRCLNNTTHRTPPHTR